MRQEQARDVTIYDELIGQRLRLWRISMGLTLQEMADLIGVTYQQAHKYEKGINRISAGRLLKLLKERSVPCATFFSEAEIGLSLADSRRAIEVVRIFQRLPAAQQAHVIGLLRSMAAPDDPALLAEYRTASGG
jgi:transcriptional regulator with XRE-family HTH domain